MRSSTPVWSAAAVVSISLALSTGLPGCSDARSGIPGQEPEAAGGASVTAAAPCNRPLETRRANASGQRPTFPGQTRACPAPSSTRYDVVVIARGLDQPWAVEPLPDGRLLISGRPGPLRIVSADGRAGPPLAGVPAVDARGQGGMLDVALSPAFADDRTIFWSFVERRSGGNATSVARGVLSEDGTRVDDVRVIVRAEPAYDGSLHVGSRLVFDHEGLLYVTLGDRSDRVMRPHAQRRDSHMGKVLRVTRDGAVPEENPFVQQQGTRPGIFTMGHRNVQAAALDPQGRVWVVEHGPQGGDELNLLEGGRNYGWPVVTFGQEYAGAAIEGAVTTREGYVDPVYYWDPVIAPSGAQFYTGDAFPEWKGNLFVGALREQRLVRLVLEADRVAGEEHLLTDRGQRVRDVRQGPDGLLYVVTDGGELLQIRPRR